MSADARLNSSVNRSGKVNNRSLNVSNVSNRHHYFLPKAIDIKKKPTNFEEYIRMKLTSMDNNKAKAKAQAEYRTHIQNQRVNQLLDSLDGYSLNKTFSKPQEEKKILFAFETYNKSGNTEQSPDVLTFKKKIPFIQRMSAKPMKRQTKKEHQETKQSCLSPEIPKTQTPNLQKAFDELDFSKSIFQDRMTSTAPNLDDTTERSPDLKSSVNRTKLSFHDVTKFKENFYILQQTYNQRINKSILSEDNQLKHGSCDTKMDVSTQLYTEQEETRQTTHFLEATATIFENQRAGSKDKRLAITEQETELAASSGEITEINNEAENHDGKNLEQKLMEIINFKPVLNRVPTAQERIEQEKFAEQMRVRMQKFSSHKKKNKSVEPTVRKKIRNLNNASLINKTETSIDEQDSTSRPLRTEDSSRSYAQRKCRIKGCDFYGMPEWLEKRKEFGEGFRKYIEGKSKRILQIAEKAPILRTNEEINIVTEWLQNISFFGSLPIDLVRVLAGKVHYRRYQKGENLCVIGDPGDCVYIIYEGMVKCYVNNIEVAKYRKHDTPGQSALHGNGARTATLTAATQCDILRLDVADYLSIMRGFVVQEKDAIANYLKHLPIFNRMNDFKLKQLANFMQAKQFTKGEYIYEEGEDAECFYILKKGLLKVEIALIIEQNNIWPANTHTWTKSKLERKVKFFDFLQPDTYFGEFEVMKNCPRLNSVVCEENSQLLILNKIEFFQCLGSKELNDFLSATKDFSGEKLEVLKEKLILQESQVKQMKDAIGRGWGYHLKSLNNVELERRNKKVIEPLISRFDNSFKSLIRRNTFRGKRSETPIKTNHE